MKVLDHGEAERVSYNLYFPSKQMREEFRNKLLSLKMSRQKPAYQVMFEALELYKVAK